MRLIKTKPRYKCDYCRHTGMQRAIERHEKVCWRNPNRYCESCDNNHFIYIDHNGDGSLVEKQPCYYCNQYDATKVPPVDEVPSERLVEARASSEAPRQQEQTDD